MENQVEDKFSVSLKAEPIFNIGGFNITNSMITTLIVGTILCILVISATRKAKLIPGRWQAFWEFIIEALLNIVEGSLGRKAGRVFFPLLGTYFIYILFANWFSLLPGVGTIGKNEYILEVPTDKPVAIADTNYGSTSQAVEVVDQSGKKLGNLEAGTLVKFLEKNADRVKVQAVENRSEKVNDFLPVEGEAEGFVPAGQLTGAKQYRELVPFLRAPNADLNMTLGMALIVIILAQIVAIRSHGIGGYIKEFFPKPYWMDPLLTPIEIVGQFARLISLTVRLFGNVFAGEALLAIILKIAFPSLFIFIGLELFFGLIQALVFFSLSAVYLTLAVSGQEGAHGTNEDEAHHDGDQHLTEQAKYPQQSEYIEKEAVGAAH